MLRLRRWCVARVRTDRKGGYDSPRTRYWTHRGARAAAIQLNMLDEKFNQMTGMLGAISGTFGENRWMPIRHRTLRGVQAHNIVMESGSYDRHPAGSGPLSMRLNRRTAAPLRYATGGVVKTNLCSITGECAGPWNFDGHCVHCGKLTVPSVVGEEETDESTVPVPVEPEAEAVGGREDAPERPVVPQQRDLHDEARSATDGGGDQRVDTVTGTDRPRNDRS